MPRLTYIKGPLGWAVAWEGKPLGVIKRTRDGYLVSMVGFRPGDGQAPGSYTFPTLAAARKKARLVARDLFT